MTCVPALMLCAVLSLITLSGCVPGEDDHVDETRDPNYQRGSAMVRSRDFLGAIEEFEKAIEVNPRSAAAHFEMAWLCEEKIKDYAAAIYHYQKYQALRPNSENSEKAREHIQVCKRELAKAEFFLPNTLALQHELDRLNAENLLLRQNIESLRTQLVAATLAAQSQPEPTPSPPAVAVTPAPVPPARLPVSNPTPFHAPMLPLETVHANPPSPGPIQPIRTATNSPAPQVSVALPRTHVVKSGESMASIASQYHVKLSAILQANPKVNPKKLRAGQSVNLPAQ